MTSKPLVFVVDDDPDLREVLTLVVRSAGHDAQAYARAEQFLENYSPALHVPQCLVLDVHLEGMSGLALQEKLREMRIVMPVVILTGYADVSLAVRAMRNGAVDCLEKPFDRATLLGSVQRSLDQHAETHWKQERKTDLASRIALLSSREREVMKLLAAAKGTKEIAATLSICPQTVAKHRTHILEKLQVDSIVELATRCGAGGD